MLVAILAAPVLLLGGCAGTETQTAPVLAEGDCPAPTIADWASGDWDDALAQELDIGDPESNWEKTQLRVRLQAILDNMGEPSQISLWDQFPQTYDAIIEYIILRKQIESC